MKNERLAYKGWKWTALARSTLWVLGDVRLVYTSMYEYCHGHII